MSIVLGLCVDGSQELVPSRDGRSGTLPTFSEEFNTVAVHCAKLLKEADPFAAVYLAVWDRELWEGNGVPLADGHAVEAIWRVNEITYAWHARTKAKS